MAQTLHLAITSSKSSQIATQKDLVTVIPQAENAMRRCRARNHGIDVYSRNRERREMSRNSHTAIRTLLVEMKSEEDDHSPEENARPATEAAKPFRRWSRRTRAAAVAARGVCSLEEAGILGCLRWESRHLDYLRCWFASLSTGPDLNSGPFMLCPKEGHSVPRSEDWRLLTVSGRQQLSQASIGIDPPVARLQLLATRCRRHPQRKWRSPSLEDERQVL